MFMLSNGKMYVQCGVGEWIKNAASCLGVCIVVGVGVGITACIAVSIISVFLKIIGG